MIGARAILLSALAGAAAACNGPPPYAGASYQTAAGGPRQCFYAANVSGFRKGPQDIVYVNTNARDYYELRTLSYCASRLDFEHRIALRSRSGSFICSGMDAEIYVPDALGATYCPVRSVRKLSPPEVAALRASR